MVKRWLAAGVVAGVLATAAWAVVGPDSIWQNVVVDPLRGRVAHGTLTTWDAKPIGNRQPWILVHGMHQSNTTVDGMPSDLAIELWALPVTNWQGIYRSELAVGEELFSRVKIFVYAYNSERDDDAIASDLNALIERNSELTGARTRLVFIAHSKGGRIVHNYVANWGERKFLRCVTLGTPHLGTIAARREVMLGECKKLYPLLGNKLFAAIERGINFDAIGTQWLRDDFLGTQALHRKMRLDYRWYLYAGEISPAPSGGVARNIQLALTADAFIGKLGNEGDFYLPICARLIKSADSETSDGLVPVASAHALGYTDGAEVRLEADTNHYEILQGRQGDLALHRRVLLDLLTFSPVEATTTNNFLADSWLPEIPIINLPKNTAGDLVAARAVWVNDRGQLMVADRNGVNVRGLPVAGKFAWPSWVGDDIIVERHGEIVQIQVDGRVVQLTNGGTNVLPSSIDNHLVWLRDGQLWIRDEDGTAAMVIADKLTLSSPPVGYANKIYFAHDGDLYWIGSHKRRARLADAKLVMTGIVQPIKIGNFLLGVNSAGEMKAILGGWFGLTELALPSSVKLSRQFIPQSVELDVDDLTGEVYLVVDGQVRWVDYGVLMSYTPGWLKDIAEGIQRQSASVTLPAPTLDELAPLLGPGSQVDVK